MAQAYTNTYVTGQALLVDRGYGQSPVRRRTRGVILFAAWQIARSCGPSSVARSM